MAAKHEFASQKIPKTIYGCTVESHESTRHKSGIFSTYKTRRLHCRQRFYFDDHYNLVHKFILMPQAMKIPDAKAAVDKGMEEARDNPSVANGESQKQKGVCSRSTKRQKKVLCATLMYTCHLRNAELEPKLQKYKGRVVLRGDVVKDDSGAYAVFTEQGSSASQMTAAKVMDVTARQPDCDGQAADAVSACTQVRRSKIAQKSEVRLLDYGIRLPRHKWPKSWSNIEDPVVLLERKLHGHPLAGLLWEREFEKVLLGVGWEKVQNWDCCKSNGSYCKITRL